MKKIVLISIMLVLLSGSQLMAQDNGVWGKPSWDRSDTIMRPSKQDAYGPGINSDATGKPFTWQTNDGQTVPAGGQVKPDGYGLGVGQDQFGRPVKPKTWP